MLTKKSEILKSSKLGLLTYRLTPKTGESPDIYTTLSFQTVAHE